MKLVPPKLRATITRQAKLGRRCNVFLDLDNTLISAITCGQLSSKYRRTDLKSHTFGSQYIIYERPGVQQFLDFLFKHFNVNVWSAASKEYVLFIVDRIILADNNRRINMIMHADHCDMSRRINRDSPKDLSFLWYHSKIHGYDKDNTFIIDDLPAVYLAQPDNCVHVPAFDVENTLTSASADKVLAHARSELHACIKPPYQQTR